MMILAERNRIYLLIAVLAVAALLAVGWVALATAQGESPDTGGSETSGMEKMEAPDYDSDSGVPYDGPTGIWVSGTGRASGAPDIAIVSLGVESVEETAATARANAATAMEDVVDVLTEADVASSDIQTRYFNISPRYQRVEIERCDDQGEGSGEGEEEQEETAGKSCYKVWENRLIGYSVSNQASVRIRSLDDTGTIIDGIVEAAGDLVRINGISFDIEDPQPLQDDARAGAVADMKRKAEMLADLSGVKLGRLVYINEGTPYSSPEQFFARAESAVFDSYAGTAISGGELEFTATVQGVYLIAGDVEPEETPEPTETLETPAIVEPETTEEPEEQGGSQ